MAAHNRENSFKEISGDPAMQDSQGASSNMLDSPDVVKKGLIKDQPQE